MDMNSLITLLKATFDAEQRQAAENQLAQVDRMNGFVPALLALVMANECEMNVRQAGAIYMKNLIRKSWTYPSMDPSSNPALAFSLLESDRVLIRKSIVDAVVLAPDLIRLQLCVVVNILITRDYPLRWGEVVEKLCEYFSKPEPAGWHGAILCLYELVKAYQYTKKPAERKVLNMTLLPILPQLCQLAMRLLPEDSDDAATLQKVVLKVFHAFIVYALPLDAQTEEMIMQWMELCRQVLERAVPAHALDVPEEVRSALPWWKCKKWSMHIICRLFKKYGSPGTVAEEYEQFATWYFSTFATVVLDMLIKLLDAYSRGLWLSPRILQEMLDYVNNCINYGHTWKLLKPHMAAIIQKLLYPLMAQKPEDEELWRIDPHEYIRSRLDCFDDYFSPAIAARTLLYSVCKKRRKVLQTTMTFLMNVLRKSKTAPSLKDGALFMVGSLSNVIMRKHAYIQQLDVFFKKIIFPEFNNKHGHMRARVCWVVHCFAKAPFQEESVVSEITRLAINTLLLDKELPVKTEAAVAVKALLNHQPKAKKYVEPQCKEIALELLTLIRETESETGVLLTLVEEFSEQLTPMALDMMQHLATTFKLVCNRQDAGMGDNLIIISLLNTVTTLMRAMEEQPDINLRLEPIILQVIGHVFETKLQEYYEEVLVLVVDLTSQRISENMWKVYEMLYNAFMFNGLDHFKFMAPALYNYLTVDFDNFLANEDRLVAFYTICKEIFAKEPCEIVQCYAAKLLEVSILRYKGRVDAAVPSMIELVATKLCNGFQTNELRNMCVQVLIACVCYNSVMTLTVLDALPHSTERFISTWMNTIDCFLTGIHDRKLCILGLCALVTQHPKPKIIYEIAPRIMPAFLTLFAGLQRAYLLRGSESISDDESESSDSDESLLSHEDHVPIETKNNEIAQEILQCMSSAGFAVGNVVDDIAENSRDEDIPAEFNLNREYVVDIDENDDYEEFITFTNIMKQLETTQNEWYQTLLASVMDKQTQLSELCVFANQQRYAREMNAYEDQGACALQQQSAPVVFHFPSASRM